MAFHEKLRNIKNYIFRYYWLLIKSNKLCDNIQIQIFRYIFLFFWKYVKRGIKPTRDLATAIAQVMPNALIGATGVNGVFTSAVLQKMAELNERPVVFALSNPTSKAECTAEDAYKNTDGRCLFSSGSPFNPVTHKDKTFYPSQGNNSYIFPGVALATIIYKSRHIDEEVFLIAAEVKLKINYLKF